MKGMEQGEAHRKARELGGIAVSARNPEKSVPWRLGGWPQADDVWIVISQDRMTVLFDGEEGNYPQLPTSGKSEGSTDCTCRGCTGTCCTGIGSDPCICPPPNEEDSCITY